MHIAQSFSNYWPIYPKLLNYEKKVPITLNLGSTKCFLKDSQVIKEKKKRKILFYKQG